MPAWLIALLPNLKDVLKDIGKWLFGYAKSMIKSMIDNAWLLAWIGICSTLFFLIMHMLNGWFGFPAILNIGIHGIYHLSSVGWVISNWKTNPVNVSGNNSSPKVNIN